MAAKCTNAVEPLCFGCSLPGHMALNCPRRRSIKDKGDSASDGGDKEVNSGQQEEVDWELFVAGMAKLDKELADWVMRGPPNLELERGAVTEDLELPDIRDQERPGSAETRGAKKTSWPGWTRHGKCRGHDGRCQDSLQEGRVQPKTEEGFLEGPFPLREFCVFSFTDGCCFGHLGDQVDFEGGGVRDAVGMPSFPA